MLGMMLQIGFGQKLKNFGKIGLISLGLTFLGSVGLVSKLTMMPIIKQEMQAIALNHM